MLLLVPLLGWDVGPSLRWATISTVAASVSSPLLSIASTVLRIATTSVWIATLRAIEAARLLLLAAKVTIGRVAAILRIALLTITLLTLLRLLLLRSGHKCLSRDPG